MSDELTWLPGWQIRELIGKGEVSPVAVVDHFLGRIEDHPELQAFAHLDVNGARDQAKAAEKAVRDGENLGPLHGLPTAAKEHIAIAGMPRKGLASAGGADGVARRDDFGIARLREAGAIIVGTNTMMGTAGGGVQREGEAGGVYNAFNWDAEARNPWDTNRVPGWSSSGGAASAAAALLPFTIGSDGGGSTRLPAAYSGVVGVHPTGGLFPNVDYDAPSIPNGITIGPLARSVRDAALVTQVMAGPDGRDPFCIQTEPGDYLTGIDEGADGMRFAWTDDFGFASAYATEESQRVIEHIRSAAMGFASIGGTVETTDERWDSSWGSAIGGAFVNIPGMARPSAEDLEAGFASRARNWDGFRRVLAGHDLLLSPTAQKVAPTVEDWNAAWTTAGSTFVGGSFAPTYTSHTAMFNSLRFPAVSVPCGFVDGLPVGLQIIGWPGREHLIFRAAQAFQRAFPRDERPAAS